VSDLRLRALVLYAQFASGLFVVLGVVGLVKSHFHAFASSNGVALLGMRVSPLMSLIHLTVGLVGIAMAITPERSRRYAMLVGAVGTPFALLEFVLGDSSGDIFGRDGDVALVQLVVALLGLAVATWSRAAAAASPRTG